jgi:hypothetical protein
MAYHHQAIHTYPLFTVVEKLGLTAALNIVAKWVTSLHIWEVRASNLDLETGCPNLGFSWFSSVPPSKCWGSTLDW